MATRATTSDPFGIVTNLGAAVNTAGNDNNPTITADGLTLAFSSNRPGGSGGQDIYLATRAATLDAFDGVTRLGREINSRDVDAAPSLSADGLALHFHSNRPGLGGTDLYVAWRSDPSGSFGYAVNLGTDINGPGNDRSPSPSFDGETLLFDSDRPGGEGGQDIYAWTRTGADWYQFTLDAGASTTLALSPFDTGTGHQALTFEQNRDGYAGTTDTYLREDSLDYSFGGVRSLDVDTDAPGVTQALVRFDGIFGSGFDQIALEDEIVSARLELEVHDRGDHMQLHRMLQDWSDTDTWNHFGGDGIQADDVEAASMPDTITAAGIEGPLSIDVVKAATATSSSTVPITTTSRATPRSEPPILPSASTDTRPEARA